MNSLNAFTKPLAAIAFGVAILLVLVTLAPAGEARLRYRGSPAAIENISSIVGIRGVAPGVGSVSVIVGNR